MPLDWQVSLSQPLLLSSVLFHHWLTLDLWPLSGGSEDPLWPYESRCGWYDGCRMNLSSGWRTQPAAGKTRWRQTWGHRDAFTSHLLFGKSKDSKRKSLAAVAVVFTSGWRGCDMNISTFKLSFLSFFMTWILWSQHMKTYFVHTVFPRLPTYFCTNTHTFKLSHRHMHDFLISCLFEGFWRPRRLKTFIVNSLLFKWRKTSLDQKYMTRHFCWTLIIITCFWTTWLHSSESNTNFFSCSNGSDVCYWWIFHLYKEPRRRPSRDSQLKQVNLRYKRENLSF